MCMERAWALKDPGPSMAPLGPLRAPWALKGPDLLRAWAHEFLRTLKSAALEPPMLKGML